MQRRKRGFDDEAQQDAVQQEGVPKRGRMIEIDPSGAQPRTVFQFSYIISLLLGKGNHYLVFLQNILSESAYDFYVSNQHTDDQTIFEEIVFTQEVRRKIYLKVLDELIKFHQFLEMVNPWEKKYLLVVNPRLMEDVVKTIQLIRSQRALGIQQYCDILGANLNFTLLEIMHDLVPDYFRSPDLPPDAQQMGVRSEMMGREQVADDNGHFGRRLQHSTVMDDQNFWDTPATIGGFGSSAQAQPTQEQLYAQAQAETMQKIQAQQMQAQQAEQMQAQQAEQMHLAQLQAQQNPFQQAQPQQAEQRMTANDLMFLQLNQAAQAHARAQAEQAQTQQAQAQQTQAQTTQAPMFSFSGFSQQPAQTWMQPQPAPTWMQTPATQSWLQPSQMAVSSPQSNGG